LGLANDSVLVTPGSGATIATQLAGGKEHQVIMLADETGQIIGSRDTYFINIAPQVNVAAANTVHWDLFNADAALLVRVRSIRQTQDMSTAVTGVPLNFKLARTTAVGTGGVTQTPWLPDLSQTALDADITCRSKPTGGATEGVVLNNFWVSSEETNTGSAFAFAMGGLELVPVMLAQMPANEHGILLRQNQGLRCVQITSSNVGNTWWTIAFTVE
jgi:hypothetical protein